MKVKPKEALLTLPMVLLFSNDYEIGEFASNINQIIHGKVKVKYELLGELGEQFVGLFYFQRNDEFAELRQEFMVLIEQEEVRKYEERRGMEKMPKVVSEEEQSNQQQLSDEEQDHQHWKSLADLGRTIK